MEEVLSKIGEGERRWQWDLGQGSNLSLLFEMVSDVYESKWSLSSEMQLSVEYYAMYVQGNEENNHSIIKITNRETNLVSMGKWKKNVENGMMITFLSGHTESGAIPSGFNA